MRLLKISYPGGRWMTFGSRSETPLSRDDHLTDWPEREPSKFHMRPSERDANNGYNQHDRGDEVT